MAKTRVGSATPASIKNVNVNSCKLIKLSFIANEVNAAERRGKSKEDLPRYGGVSWGRFWPVAKLRDGGRCALAGRICQAQEQIDQI